MNGLTLNQFENSNEFRTILDGHYFEFIVKYKDGNLDLNDSKVKATIKTLKKRGLLWRFYYLFGVWKL